jgi:phage terminase large subunit-like protein
MANILTEKEKELQSYYQALQFRDTFHKIDLYYPDKKYISSITNEIYYAREEYKKSLDFFKAGATYRQRLLLAANRSGKTISAGYELVCHLTGIYPDWWEGKRYEVPKDWWVVGTTSEKVVEHLQPLLIGGLKQPGTGLIPRQFIDIGSLVQPRKTSKAVPSFRINHISGGFSTVEFKSYEQGRTAFESTVRCIWFDEEPPEDVYTECITRTMTSDGIIMITFTPLAGMSSVIKNFTNGGDYTEGEKGPGKYVINQTWDDVPHLDEATKTEMLASYPEYQRLARARGIPNLGAGAVWPVAESSFKIEPLSFPFPDHWKRVCAIDFGWTKPTAILWAAIDPESDIMYIYAEHYFKEKPPLFHVQALEQRDKAAGFKIPVICDPSGGGKSNTDGKTTRLQYEKDYGIVMMNANNARQAGFNTTLDRFNAGKIKVYSTCTNFFSEFMAFQYDPKKSGETTGEDHLMDCLRYLVMTGPDVAMTKAYYNAQTSGIIIEQQEHWDTGLEDGWYYS